ncbi:putative leader peptide [Kitasatospora sp. NPDC049285]
MAVVTVKARCRVTTTYARLHIDLQRVSTALCPATPHAVARRGTPYRAA